MRVVGVQSEHFPSMAEALGVDVTRSLGRRGRPTVAEGIAVERPGALTCEVARELVDEVRLVSDASVERAKKKPAAAPADAPARG